MMAFALAFLASAMATSAAAQGTSRDPRARGPYRGLFGGHAASPDSQQALDLFAGIFAGHDDDVSGSATPTQPASTAIGLASNYAGGSVDLRYRRHIVDRLSLAASTTAWSSYYPDLEDLLVWTYGAALGLAWNPNSRTSVTVNQSLQFSPFFTFYLFPVAGLPGPTDVTPIPGIDTRVVRQDNLRSSSHVSLSRRATRRATVTGFGHYDRTWFDKEGALGLADWESWGAGARWTYRLTSHASWRTGYNYRTGRSGDEGPARRDRDVGLHTLDIGIDYARALSFSRNTRFSFGTGTTVYRELDVRTASFEGDYRAAVTGNARLTHALGRSWSAAVSYVRDLQFADGFREPFLVDAISTGVGGFLGPRWRWTTGTGVAWGDYGIARPLAGDARRTRTAYASSAVQFALATAVAVEGVYYYYWYRFDEGAAELPGGLSPRVERQGFRLGLTTWIPLLR